MIFINWYKSPHQLEMNTKRLILMLILILVCSCFPNNRRRRRRSCPHWVDVETNRAEHDETRKRIDDVQAAVSHPPCPGGQKWSPQYLLCFGKICGKGTFQVLNTIVYQVLDIHQKYVNVTLDAQASCELCSPGFFTENEGSKNCLRCPAGKYQNGTDTTRCLSCEAGRTTTEGKAISCVECTPGKFSTTGSNTGCINCAPGTFASATGSTRCADCPIGRFSQETARTACNTCSAGQFQNKSRSASCEACPVGTYSGRGNKSCVKCPFYKCDVKMNTTSAHSFVYYIEQRTFISQCCASSSTTYNTAGEQTIRTFFDTIVIIVGCGLYAYSLQLFAQLIFDTLFVTLSGVGTRWTRFTIVHAMDRVGYKYPYITVLPFGVLCILCTHHSKKSPENA